MFDCNYKHSRNPFQIVTYHSDKVGAAGVTQQMRQQNLESCGRGAARRYNNILKNK